VTATYGSNIGTYTYTSTYYTSTYTSNTTWGTSPVTWELIGDDVWLERLYKTNFQFRPVISSFSNTLINESSNYNIIIRTWRMWLGWSGGQPLIIAEGTENDSRIIPSHERIAELRCEQRQRESINRATAIAQAEEAVLADQKARELLESVLNKSQKKTYRENNLIYLTSQKGKRYRIQRSSIKNVAEIDNRGHIKICYCATSTELVPLDDTVLTQYLCLKYCEDDFLKIANRWAA
jgi:hypothetical protein